MKRQKAKGKKKTARGARGLTILWFLLSLQIPRMFREKTFPTDKKQPTDGANFIQL